MQEAAASNSPQAPLEVGKKLSGDLDSQGFKAIKS